uniref:Uncharacterized protein n=1 Tax=Trichogramma kaykai TaxID=54128 RepID=A0ABD2W4G1_9HYME
MSFLHAQSCECLKSKLLLFDIPPTQTTIEGSHWIHYKPISSLTDDSPIEFVVPGNGKEYIDLAHTMLSSDVELKLKLNELKELKLKLKFKLNELQELKLKLKLKLNELKELKLKLKLKLSELKQLKLIEFK